MITAGVRRGTRNCGWVFGRSDRFRLDISGFEDSWLHTSHHLTNKFKTNMNIVFKSNVRELLGLSASRRVFQTSQICDTHAYFHHLITCANQKRIGSGNTRFFCFTCYAFKQPKQCFWCIITSSQAFFYRKSPGDERSGSRRNVLVTVKSGIAFSHILELENNYFNTPTFIKKTKQDETKFKIIF